MIHIEVKNMVLVIKHTISRSKTNFVCEFCFIPGLFFLDRKFNKCCHIFSFVLIIKLCCCFSLVRLPTHQPAHVLHSFAGVQTNWYIFFCLVSAAFFSHLFKKVNERTRVGHLLLIFECKRIISMENIVFNFNLMGKVS